MKDTEGMNDLWEYDIGENSWREINQTNTIDGASSSSIPSGRHYQSAVVYKNMMVMVAGYGSNSPLKDWWILDLGKMQ